MVAVGLIAGALTLFWLGAANLKPATGTSSGRSSSRGSALAALFVPLTTISMDPIPRERMGNATSLFNLMRNLGGSIGIAMTGTLLARKQQEYVNVLGAHVTPYSQAARASLEAARSGFIASGVRRRRPRPSAPTRAVFGTVQRQASMVAFVGCLPAARDHFPAALAARAVDAAAPRARGRPRRTEQPRAGARNASSISA